MLKVKCRQLGLAPGELARLRSVAGDRYDRGSDELTLTISTQNSSNFFLISKFGHFWHKHHLYELYYSRTQSPWLARAPARATGQPPAGGYSRNSGASKDGAHSAKN